jgi:hypothetical protein
MNKFKTVELLYIAQTRGGTDYVPYNYKITYEDDSVNCVPLEPANRHYQAIQEWIAEGNTVIDNGAGQ